MSDDAVATLCAHPRFPEAIRTLMAGNVRLYRGNRVLNYIVSDRGRLLVGLLAFYLHASRRPEDRGSGPTARRLKALCVEQDICSPGRAGALLSLMRLFGHVEPATDPDDRRLNRLVPTELLIASLRERWRLIFGAMVPLLPEGAAALAALDRDEFLTALVRIMAEHFRTGSIAYMAGEINSALYSSMQKWVNDGTIVPGRVVPNLINVDYFDCANYTCSQTMESKNIITLLNNLS